MDRLSIRKNAEKSSEEIFSKGICKLIAKSVDESFLFAALLERLFKFFLYIIQRGLRVGGSLVLAVCFPDVPDDAVQIIVYDVAVKIAFLHLRHREGPARQHHPQLPDGVLPCPLRGAIRLNLLTDRVDIVRDLGWRRNTSALTDTDVKYLLLYFEQNYGLTSEKKDDSGALYRGE